MSRPHAPMTRWLPEYERRCLAPDAIAGLTVWALVVPESMAYAAIAGVPVQFGLYSVPLAIVGYAVFGTSRRLFVGPSSSFPPSAIAGAPWRSSRSVATAPVVAAVASVLPAVLTAVHAV